MNSESQNKIKIIADDREARSLIARTLYELGSNVESKRIEVGDFICSERVCVERKDAKDFVASLVDRRLFQQAKDMSEQFQRPIMIIENYNDIFSYRNIHPNAIRGAIASIAVDYGISVIASDSQEETARIIYAIAKKEQEENERAVSLRGVKSKFTEMQQQEFLVEGLPMVGPKLAKELLKNFKTVRNVFNASAEELKNIKNLGDKKSEAIRKIIDTVYKDG